MVTMAHYSILIMLLVLLCGLYFCTHFLPFCNRTHVSVFLHRKKNMIFTFVILLSDCEHKHVLYDNSLINHMFGGGSVNISVFDYKIMNQCLVKLSMKMICVAPSPFLLLQFVSSACWTLLH